MHFASLHICQVTVGRALRWLPKLCSSVSALNTILIPSLGFFSCTDEQQITCSCSFSWHGTLLINGSERQWKASSLLLQKCWLGAIWPLVAPLRQGKLCHCYVEVNVKLQIDQAEVFNLFTVLNSFCYCVTSSFHQGLICIFLLFFFFECTCQEIIKRKKMMASSWSLFWQSTVQNQKMLDLKIKTSNLHNWKAVKQRIFVFLSQKYYIISIA